MQARSSLNLPSAKTLQSNSKEAIQDWARKLVLELDKQYRLLYQDINVPQIDADKFITFGGKDTDGSWRIGRSGDNLITQRRESGVWVTKDTITP